MLGNLATGSSRPRRLLLALFVLSILILLPTFANAQAVIKVNDDVSFRVGAQLQLWGDMAQDATTNEYNQNLFIRRARVLLTGSVMKDVTFFIQPDNPNIGKTPKALGSGFVLQDAWAEWKISDQFMLGGGLMLVPLSREELTSTTSFQTIDISPTATVFATPTQTSATREDRKSTRLNSSHTVISYAVFCLKKKNGDRHSMCPSVRVLFPCIRETDNSPYAL